MVIVSPIRGPLVCPENVEELEWVEEEFEEGLYERQVCHLHKMCKSVFASNSLKFL